MEWINVKDRLPEVDTEVIIYNPSYHGYETIGKLTNCNKWHILNGFGSIEMNSITHWKPLPEPPKD